MAEVTGLRNDALNYPVYGVPYGVTFPILDADGDLVTGAAGLDSERSLNGDTFADCTNEATEIATASGMYYLLLTAAELTADVVTVIVKTSTTGAKTTPIVLYPRKLVTLRSGTVGANAADGTTLQLDSGAVAIDDYYNGCLLVGTLDSVVEARIIADYVGSTKVCTVSPAFVTTPDNNDTFVVSLPEGKQVIDANLATWLAVVPLALSSQQVQAVVPVTQQVDVNTIKTNPVVNGGTFTFPTNATGASTTNIAAGTITTVTTTTTATNLTNAPTNGDFTATMKTSIGTAVAASAVASVTGNVGGNVVGSVGSVVGAVGSVTGAVGSVTGNVGGNVAGSTGSVTGNVGGNVAGSVGSVTGNVGGNVVGSVDSVVDQVSANLTAIDGTPVIGDGGAVPWGP